MKIPVRNPLANWLGKEALWANPEESIGEFIKTINGKKHCWKAKGRAREVFEILAKDIKTYTDKCVDSIPGSNWVTWSIYMIGKTPQTAVPVVMFFCEDPGPRRNVQDSVKQSKILEGYPGIKSGNAAVPPDLEQLELLAFDAVSHKDTVKSECAKPHFNISMSQNKVFVESHHGNTSSTRIATAGGIVQYNGDAYVFTAGHLFDEISTSGPSRESRIIDDEWEIDSDSDSDNDSDTEIDYDEEFVESTSTASNSGSDDGSSDAPSTPSSSFPDAPTPVEDRFFSQRQATSCQVIQTRASEDTTPAMDVHRFGRNPSVLPPSAATEGHLEGHLVVLSADFDYALIKCKDPSLLAAKDTSSDKSAANLLQPIHVITAAVMDTEIMTYTASGGLMSGTLYGTPSYTRLPNSKTFQKVYTVRPNGALVKGDCGSWVIDAETRGLYGHIIAGCESTGIAYIMSAHNVFEDAKERLGGQRLLGCDFASEANSSIDLAEIAEAVSAENLLMPNLHSPILDDFWSPTLNLADKDDAQSPCFTTMWTGRYQAENDQKPPPQPQPHPHPLNPNFNHSSLELLGAVAGASHLSWPGSHCGYLA